VSALAVIGCISLTGCGGSTPAVGSSGSGFVGSSHAAPLTVAKAFATYYARIAANEDDPATPAQVRAYASALHVSCSAPVYGQYPCTVRPPTQTPTVVQRCTATADADGRVLGGRCRGDDGPAPIITPRYIGCSSVGHVVSVADPEGIAAAERAAHKTSALQSPGDVLELKVAATATQFCADIETAQPMRPGATYELSLDSQANDQIHFEPSIDYRFAHNLDLEDSNSDIPGQVGQSARWTSLLIRTRDLGTPDTRVLAPPFTFSVLSEFIDHHITAAQRETAAVDGVALHSKTVAYP
jgi:hypothetical protein